MTRHAVIFEENLRIPEEAFTFDGFERWLASPEFPDTGRIDFLAGDVEVDMSPEELHTHGIVKVAFVATLHDVIVKPDRGEIFSDRARFSSPKAGLSTEPDVVVVLWDSLREGRVRYGSLGNTDKLSKIEGAPDLVVEVVSDSSVNKDTRRLPPLYARAGVAELWIADVRGRRSEFRVLTLRQGAYTRIEPGPDGWIRSPRLGVSFRLTRRRTPVGTWQYVLERRDD